MKRLRKWRRKDMRAYQEGMIEFFNRVKRCAFFVDPGLGKTSATLTAIAQLIDDMTITGMTLIVAPPRVARETWPREFLEWAHLNDRTFVYVGGSIARRRKLLKRRAEFHIVSMDTLMWLLVELGGDHTRYEKNAEGDLKRVKGSKWRAPESMPYQAIVFDESSMVKNQDTNRWKAMRMLSRSVEYLLLLTGTPAANSVHDLWAQIFLLDFGKRLGTTLTAFRERWFFENYNGYGYKAKRSAVEVIESLISDIVFTLREEDYADLPPRMYNPIRIEMDTKAAKQYREFEKTLVLEVPDERSIVVDGGAALRSKLKQLANGVVYRTDDDFGEKSEHFYHSLKLDAMAELVEELNGKPIFVAYEFKSDLRRIMKKFPQARRLDKKSETQDEWNRGEIPILLAHPRSAAHGLNMQFGGCHILWYTLTDSLEAYIQFNKRLHRSGQKQPVMVHKLLVQGTVDDDVEASLDSKNDVQEMLLNLLKKRIRSYK